MLYRKTERGYVLRFAPNKAFLALIPQVTAIIPQNVTIASNGSRRLILSIFFLYRIGNSHKRDWLGIINANR